MVKIKKFFESSSDNVESLKDALSELMDSKFVEIIENRDRVRNKSIFHVAVGSLSKILIFVELDNYDDHVNSYAPLYQDRFRDDIKRLRIVQKGKTVPSYANTSIQLKEKVKKSFDEMVEVYDLIEEGLVRSQIEYNDITYFIESVTDVYCKWHRGLRGESLNQLLDRNVYFMVFIIN